MSKCVGSPSRDRVVCTHGAREVHPPPIWVQFRPLSSDSKRKFTPAGLVALPPHRVGDAPPLSPNSTPASCGTPARSCAEAATPPLTCGQPPAVAPGPTAGNALGPLTSVSVLPLRVKRRWPSSEQTST